ncbi:NAD(P)-binding domain-containing protein [Oceanibaculum nanhaiense]|uniref:NAD(P)-binding domain-containing protein n=1 Tax=Oceanibaculum nanhaiense TaxID=1909734 RepID=UPI003D2A1F1A
MSHLGKEPVLPVVVIGAGPVGLAAAARLVERGLPFLVLEAGPVAGDSVRRWQHVRMFSPWRFNIDRAARALLQASGWTPPPQNELPTGGDLVGRYLEPLAKLPQIAPFLRFGARVVSVGREALDKAVDAGRAETPFAVEIVQADGRRETVRARAVIDASGTWTAPNPMGAGGYPAAGEARFADRIAYGIPDVKGRDRARYAGRRVLVVGGGHSAINVVLDLLALKETAPETAISWAVRRADPQRLFGGGAADALPARGELGTNARQAIEAGTVTLLAPFRATDIAAAPEGGLLVSGSGREVAVDEIVVTTGFRPDLSFLREIRLGIDPALECATALAPLIDPNIHSCGTVRPHGAAELSHPEPGFYIAGMKSYGRAPTFLLATGHEQVRSIVAALAGDMAAAAKVELDLPETGVCSAQPTNRDDIRIADTAVKCCAPAKV